jgi:threonine aldolase
MAMRMKEIFRKKGYQFLVDSPTNQQFVVIANELAERLSRKVAFSHFGQTDHHHTICRFVTSWATTEEEIDFLEQLV